MTEDEIQRKSCDIGLALCNVAVMNIDLFSQADDCDLVDATQIILCAHVKAVARLIGHIRSYNLDQQQFIVNKVQDCLTEAVESIDNAPKGN